jgi:TRAP-type uncharacterized transport system substrate-binding protein
MKTFPVSLVCLVLLLSLPASARDDVVIAGGTPGATYQSYAINLRSRLPAFRTTTRSTKGSIENLELLADGKADIGFAQVDAYAALVRADPERFGQIGIVGNLSDECIFIAYRKEGRVETLLDLQNSEGPRPKLAVGSPESGMHATWTFLQVIEPAFGATEIQFTEGTLAINHLATGLTDAVGWVSDPRNQEHKLLRAVHANRALGLLSLENPDLAHELDNGTRIYELREVPVTSSFSPETVATLCTSSMIFTKPGAEPALVQAVSDVLSLDRKSILKLRP